MGRVNKIQNKEIIERMSEQLMYMLMVPSGTNRVDNYKRCLQNDNN